MHRRCKKCGDSTGLFDNRPGAMYSESLVRSLQESVREGRQAKAILTDLIASLWDLCGEDDEWIGRLLNQAEQQLRAVQDE